MNEQITGNVMIATYSRQFRTTCMGFSDVDLILSSEALLG